jgi:hypothetical protein
MNDIRAGIVAAVAAAAGVAVGIGSAALEAEFRPWRVGDFSPAAPTPVGPTPQVEAPETRHGFGVVGIGAEGSHAFTIRNRGAAPLVLSRGATSCTCTVSDFDVGDGGTDATGRKTVAPGGETTVNVTWRGKGPGGPFRQQATILTNDPRRPEIAFVVEGTVVPTWKAVPEVVVFPKVSAATGGTATVKVFTFGSAPPTVVSLSIANGTARDLVSLTSAPIDAGDIDAEPGATGGFLLTVTLRPGAPLGRLRETAQMVFRIPEEIAADLPIEGSVAGDIALAGRGWDARRQCLSLGTVSSRLGIKTTLFLTTRGPHRDAVKPVVRDILPQGMTVTVGSAEAVGDGGVFRIPLEFVIPPGSPQANHLGSDQAPIGRVVLDTGLPDAEPFTIPVSVVIGP